MDDIILDKQEIAGKPFVIAGKKHFTAPGVIAGYLFFVGGSIGLIDSIFFSSSFPRLLISLFITLLGLIFITTREGFLLNVEKGSYKKCTFFLGRAYGVWVKLPEIESVNVSPINYRGQNAVTPSITFKENRYKVILFIKGAERGIMVSLYNKTEAIEVANKLGNSLGVPVITID